MAAPIAGYATAGCLHGKCKRMANKDVINHTAIICKDKRCEQWLKDLEEFSKIEPFNIQQIAKDYFVDIHRYEINKEDEIEVNEFILARDAKRHQLDRFTKKYKLHINAEHTKRQLLADQDFKAYEEQTMQELTRCEEQVNRNKRARTDEHVYHEVREHEVDDDPFFVPPNVEMMFKQRILSYIRDGNQTEQEFYDLLFYTLPNVSHAEAEYMWNHREEYACSDFGMEKMDIMLDCETTA